MDISITEKFFVATPSFNSNCNTTHPSKWKGTPAEDYNPKIVRYNDLLHFLDGFPPHPSYTNMSHCIPSQHPLPGAITLTKKELPCTICNRFFLRPSTLRVHMRIHNGEKPFKCTYCPKAFSQSGNLTVHLRTHTGEKPFPCHVCGKSFSQSTSLTGHLRTHTGERPYQCDGCNKSFADRSTLTKHRRTHTRAEWVKTRDFPMRDTIEHLQFQRCIEMTAQY